MSAPSLETEFNQYWTLLTSGERQSLLSVAKNYVELKKEASIDIAEYNKEIDEAVARVEAGEYYTHDEVVKMSQDW